MVARAPWRAPYRHLTELAASALVVVIWAAQDSPCVPRRLDQDPAFVQRVFDRGMDFLIGMSIFHRFMPDIVRQIGELSSDNPYTFRQI